MFSEDQLVTYSPSQLAAWLDCPTAHHYSYTVGLRKKASTKALDKGTYYHELSHVYYHTLKMGLHKPGSDFLVNMMRSRIKSDLSRITPENILVVKSVSDMILNFVQFQSPKIDAKIKEILGVELELKVPVTTHKGRNVLLHGILDLLYRDVNGKIVVRDHKTQEIAEKFVEAMELCFQRIN